MSDLRGRATALAAGALFRVTQPKPLMIRNSLALRALELLIQYHPSTVGWSGQAGSDSQCMLKLPKAAPPDKSALLRVSEIKESELGRARAHPKFKFKLPNFTL